MISWTNLKIDSHIQLSCGCEGFVKSLHFERDPLLSGFMFIHTKIVCGSDISCEEIYKNGEPFIQKFFNANVATGLMPAIIVPEPKWWNDIIADETNPEKLL